jgi:hypothetical protein
MKEKTWLIMGTIMAVGAVVLAGLRILPIDTFGQLAIVVFMAIFNEQRLSSNNASWTAWGEQQKAEFAALVKAATEKKDDATP